MKAEAEAEVVSRGTEVVIAGDVEAGVVATATAMVAAAPEQRKQLRPRRRPRPKSRRGRRRVTWGLSETLFWVSWSG